MERIDEVKERTALQRGEQEASPDYKSAYGSLWQVLEQREPKILGLKRLNRPEC